MRAEALVADHLVELGYTIVAVNLRVGRLELDVVARDGAVIAVVEVRARGAGSWQRPLDSVDARKRMRIRRAAERLWSERFAHDPSIERMRFDVAGVDLSVEGEARIEIVRGAF
ncbi:Endonuclease [Minicystis rosea]|nr:Endonuclease [Minicystis rosea]